MVDCNTKGGTAPCFAAAPSGEVRGGGVAPKADIPKVEKWVVAAWIKDACTRGPLDGARYEVLHAGEKKPILSETTKGLTPLKHEVDKPGRYVVRVLAAKDPETGREVKGDPILGQGEVDARPADRETNPPEIYVRVSGKLQIRAADGSEPPVRVRLPGDGTLGGKVNLTAVLTPRCPGAFKWTTKSKRIALENDATETVTVVGKGADVEEVEVAFTPEGAKALPPVKAKLEFDVPIHLTFDDGPHPITKEILELLRTSEPPIKATFFLCGENVEGKAKYDIVAEMIRDGHTLGNHGFDHDPGTNDEYARERKASGVAGVKDDFTGNVAHFEELFRDNGASFPGFTHARLPAQGRKQPDFVDMITKTIKLPHVGWDFEFGTVGIMTHLTTPWKPLPTVAASSYVGLELPAANDIVLVHDHHWEGKKDLLRTVLTTLKGKRRVFVHPLPAEHARIKPAATP